MHKTQIEKTKEQVRTVERRGVEERLAMAIYLIASSALPEELETSGYRAHVEPALLHQHPARTDEAPLRAQGAPHRSARRAPL